MTPNHPVLAQTANVDRFWRICRLVQPVLAQVAQWQAGVLHNSREICTGGWKVFTTKPGPD